MIFVLLLVFLIYVLLAVWLSFAFGKRMGERSILSDASFWLFFLNGAARIFLIVSVAGAVWFGLSAFDGVSYNSIAHFALLCAAMAVYTGIFWLPAYSFCFWDTRRTALMARTE